MGKVVDYESAKLLKESGEAIDKMEEIIEDVATWPEHLQEQFAEEANKILGLLLEVIKKFNNEQ